MWAFSLILAEAADLAVNKRWASVNFVRKASNTIGEWEQRPCGRVVQFPLPAPSSESFDNL